MKIHEYQAKEIFRKFGVPTPRGEMVTTPEQARAVAEKLGTKIVVVKAQIHAGGRGKAGGVKLAKSPAEAADLAKAMMGMKLVTPQTGPSGRIVQRLLIEEGLDIKRELYLSILVDRAVAAPVIMASTAGGMEIEEVAPFLQALCRAFLETDASLAEINPLIVTGDGKLVALDAKMAFDDNALYRHKDIAELRDLNEEDPLEVEASTYKLNYIKLDGNVGCMVNGAGLAMSTMDIIKLSGGSPANFLDVGGGASAEQVKNAFKILVKDPSVKGVFINIFGGILRCDVLASGVVAAAKELNLKLPVVVRMEGTNVEKGQEILRDSGLGLTIAKDMKDGADKIVKLAGGAR
jgi:succinyl-CoA synthetase beta subunit